MDGQGHLKALGEQIFDNAMAHQTRGSYKSDVFHTLSFSGGVLGLVIAGLARARQIVHEQPCCTGLRVLWLTLMVPARL